MNLALSSVIRKITGKESTGECSRQELSRLADKYPFFGAAQLLLALKLREEDHAGAAAQLRKTALYFQQPQWLDYLLSGKGEAETEEITSLPTSFTSDIAAPATATTVEEPAAVAEEIPGTPLPSPSSTVIETPFTEEEVVVQVPGTEENAEENQAPPEGLPMNLQIGQPQPMELTFEPYHTVDYFASQGIKFKEEEKPKDRFSQQLKSFTEWLRTMKKLPATEMADKVSAGEESKVEQMAQHSISDREVLTEAMAEVWEKQGNPEKAKEVYRKLSLLDPSKSSYFAAKIEQLKHS